MISNLCIIYSDSLSCKQLKYITPVTSVASKSTMEAGHLGKNGEINQLWQTLQPCVGGRRELHGRTIRIPSARVALLGTTNACRS